MGSNKESPPVGIEQFNELVASLSQRLDTLQRHYKELLKKSNEIPRQEDNDISEVVKRQAAVKFSFSY